jgi:hypothetical protein
MARALRLWGRPAKRTPPRGAPGGAVRDDPPSATGIPAGTGRDGAPGAQMKREHEILAKESLLPQYGGKTWARWRPRERRSTGRPSRRNVRRSERAQAPLGSATASSPNWNSSTSFDMRLSQASRPRHRTTGRYRPLSPPLQNPHRLSEVRPPPSDDWCWLRRSCRSLAGD